MPLLFPEFHVKKIIVLLLALSFSLSAVAQDATPPSESSIRTLLDLTNSRKLVEGSYGRIDQMMQSTMQLELKGDKPTPAQQAVIDDLRGKLVALLTEQMSWDKFEPKIIDIYQKTFSQNEIDGMIAFYSSPAGQAVVAKLPLVQQNTMLLMQSQIRDLMPKVIALTQEASGKLKADAENQDSH